MFIRNSADNLPVDFQDMKDIETVELSKTASRYHGKLRVPPEWHLTPRNKALS